MTLKKRKREGMCRHCILLRLFLILLALSGVVSAKSTHAAVADKQERKDEHRILPVLAVMDFVDASEVTHEYGWMSEALSDLLTSGLSESRKLAVVDRENLLGHYKEMQLGETASISTASASHFGRIAKANHVVFGSFSVNEAYIIVNAVN